MRKRDREREEQQREGDVGERDSTKRQRRQPKKPHLFPLYPFYYCTASARASATGEDATAAPRSTKSQEHLSLSQQRTRSPFFLLRDALPLRLGGNGRASGGDGGRLPSSSPSPLCYADAAGAALPSDALLDEICSELKRTLYTNPHSGGEGSGAAERAAAVGVGASSASSASRAAADECRAATLELLKAPPDEYSVVFVSGSTAALALVAEAFPWERRGSEEEEGGGGSGGGNSRSLAPRSGSGCGSSRFLYTRDNHTSVLGLRSAALSAGASATPVAISRRDGVGSGSESGRWLLSRAGATMERCGGGGGGRRNPGGKVPCLLAFPLESNFSGARYSERAGESLRPPGRSGSGDLSSPCRSSSPPPPESGFDGGDEDEDEEDSDWSVVEDQRQQQQRQGEKARRRQHQREENFSEEDWFVLADGAKAAAAGSASLPDLSSCPVDFLCLSFYKLFGCPTGLGALVVSRRGLEALRRGRQGLGLAGANGGNGQSRFFGGGTVLSVSASSDAVSLRPGVSGLEDGTPAFLAIAALRVAFRHFAASRTARREGGERGTEGVEPQTLRSSLEASGARACAVASVLASGLLSLRHSDGSRVAVVYGNYEGAEATDEEEEGNGFPVWARGGAPLEGGKGKADAVVGQGAVVAFNLLRPRSSSSSSTFSSSSSSLFFQRAVGHREVERLASLHGVMLRGGTLCNPGAAELALGFSSSSAPVSPPCRLGGGDGRGNRLPRRFRARLTREPGGSAPRVVRGREQRRRRGRGPGTGAAVLCRRRRKG